MEKWSVLYEDPDLVVINKNPGIAVQPDQTGDISLQEEASKQLGLNLLLTHRLDRAASGLIVFAKNKNAQEFINHQFRDKTLRKVYLVVTAAIPENREGQLVHYLRKSSETHKSKAFDQPVAHAEKAELTYRIIGQSDRFFLWEVILLTGRFHQIRAQLSAAGCPVKGDVKYGFRRGNKDRSIHLHAWKITFQHPDGSTITLEAPLPEDKIWHLFVSES